MKQRVDIRKRIFWYMVAVGTVPLALALVLLAQQQRSLASPAGPRAALEEVSASSRELLAAADSSADSTALKDALQQHVDIVVRGTRLARQAETLTRTAATALTITILAFGVVILSISVLLARRWSASITAPIEELIDWVERIDRQEPIPDTHVINSSDYDGLRHSLRTMADNLTAARAQALEQERLQAFRETARRVAHEVRGPLTSIRLALAQMPPEPSEPLAVLNDEAQRLDRLSSEFADFGRMAAGPKTEVNLHEMLTGIVNASLENTPVSWDVPGTPTVCGRFETLRRAFQNILINAARITDERGIRVRIAEDQSGVSVQIADFGPGIPPDQRDRIFDPYVSGREGGTGLGLAIARQAIEEHGGSISVLENDPGAVFAVTLPGAP